MVNRLTVFGGPWPGLSEYMATVTHRGKPRDLATITLFAESGKLKVCLNDKDTDRVLFRSGDTLEEAMDALEEACRSDRADWRQSRRKASK